MHLNCLYNYISLVKKDSLCPEVQMTNIQQSINKIVSILKTTDFEYHKYCKEYHNDIFS